MKALTLPVISMNFIDSIGKTAIQVNLNGKLETVWANGDQSTSNALLVNLVVNEIGDQFVATSDSKTLDANNAPLFLKGATVTRQKQTTEFKSFAGNNAPAQFAQSASAFGLQLNVVMQG